MPENKPISHSVLYSKEEATRTPDVWNMDKSYAMNIFRPRTFYRELAEMGALYDFLMEYMEKRFNEDELFRRDMLTIFIESSTVIHPEIEKILLQELHNTLSDFLERTPENGHNKIGK